MYTFNHHYSTVQVYSKQVCLKGLLTRLEFIITNNNEMVHLCSEYALLIIIVYFTIMVE